MKITADNKDKVLRKIGKNIFKVVKDAVKKAVAESYVDAIRLHIPVVTGGLQSSFQVGNLYSNNDSFVIGTFTGMGGVAEMLELGKESPTYQREYGQYPQGKFIIYEDEPHLKEWATAKNLITRYPKGLFVGNPKTTHFGVGRNKWFSLAFDSFQQPFIEKLPGYVMNEIKKQIEGV